MKKHLFFVPLILILTMFTGCSLPFLSEKDETALSVGAFNVDREIFSYFYSEALSYVERNSEDLLDTEHITQLAVDGCCRYAAASVLFDKFGLKQDTASLKAIAADTEEKWHLYSSYYIDCGISKQTIAEICRFERCRLALLTYFFDNDGENALSESEIRKYFDSHYVAFKSITGRLTDVSQTGEESKVSDKTKLSLRNDLDRLKEEIEEGKTIDEVNDNTEIAVTFSAIDDPMYPNGFLAEIAKLKYGAPAVIETDDSIFLVVRINAKSDENNYYSTYRTELIDKMRGSVLDDNLLKATEEYNIERHNDVIQEAAGLVIQARNIRK